LTAPVLVASHNADVGMAAGIDILRAGGSALDAVEVVIRAVEDNPDDQWHDVLDVNVLGVVRTTRAALPHLRRSEHAAVVNVCSIAATAGLPRRALYSASKGAVLSLTLAMAADHVREGIRVNCVNPGTVDTPWVGRLLDAADDPAAERAALSARQPTGRLVSAEEVAAAVVYLASPAAGSVTVQYEARSGTRRCGITRSKSRTSMMSLPSWRRPSDRVGRRSIASGLS